VRLIRFLIFLIVVSCLVLSIRIKDWVDQMQRELVTLADTASAGKSLTQVLFCFLLPFCLPLSIVLSFFLSFFILSFILSVFLSLVRRFTLSFRLSFYHSIILSFFHEFVLSFFHSFILSFFHSFFPQACHNRAINIFSLMHCNTHPFLEDNARTKKS